ncbi:MAG: ATP-binding cassette domain-containing protein [Thaumarchaeota archaeon]|nr:ATP-binding cassette domain-containing protein [Nitrososphaerota archaeon]
MTTSEYVIDVKDLTKRFGEKMAVENVTFNTKRSEVFGFLGPNGAGKTTTIKMLTTLLPPTSGTASVLGFDLKTQGRKIRERIGVVQQQDSFDQGLNVETSMEVYGLIWDVPKKLRRDRIDELIERFGMHDFRKLATLDLSAGQRRRLQVAREFIHDMDLLFLDEPTVGLDPIVRRNVLDYIKDKVKDGLTIFFTTHILEEAEYLCDRIAVINQGRIIQIDTPGNLKRRFGSAKAVEFNLQEESPPGFVENISSQESISSLTYDKSTKTYRTTTSRPELVIPEIYRIADRFRLTISSIFIAQATLEDAFINMVTEDDKETKGRETG